MNFQVLKNFTVNTPQGEKILQAGDIIALSEDKAKALVDKGKIEAVSIKWNTLSSIHLQTARELAEAGQNLRLYSQEIAAIENRLNETWLDCLHGEATLDDFNAINQLWANAIRAAGKQVNSLCAF